MDMKFSKKDPTPFGAKSHRARPYLGSNPLKGPANQITVQSSTSTTHHSKYIHLLEDGRAATKVQHYITEKEKRLFASANALAVYKTFKSILPKRGITMAAESSIVLRARQRVLLYILKKG